MNPVIQYLLKRYNYFEPKIEVLKFNIIRINGYEFTIGEDLGSIILDGFVNLDDFDSFYWEIYELLDENFKSIKEIIDLFRDSFIFKNIKNNKYKWFESLERDCEDFLLSRNIDYEKIIYGFRLNEDLCFYFKFHYPNAVKYFEKYSDGIWIMIIKYNYTKIKINLYRNLINLSIDSDFINYSKIKDIFNSKTNSDFSINKYFKCPNSEICLINRYIDFTSSSNIFYDNYFTFFIYSKNGSEISNFIDKNFRSLFGKELKDQEIFNKYFDLTDRILNSEIIHKLIECIKNNYYEINSKNPGVKTFDIMNSKFLEIISNNQSIINLNPKIVIDKYASNNRRIEVNNGFEIRADLINNHSISMAIRTRNSMYLFIKIKFDRINVQFSVHLELIKNPHFIDDYSIIDKPEFLHFNPYKWFKQFSGF